MTNLTLELEDSTLHTLSRLADTKAESVSELIKQAIKDFLETEQEALEDDARYLDCLENGGIENQAAIAWLEALGRGERRPCPK